MELSNLEALLHELEAVLAGTERINTTPVPRAYARHTSRFLSLYCSSLPLVMVSDFGWFTIPAVLWTSWALFSVEELGAMLENPFAIQARVYGKARSTIPLDAICAKIWRSTTGILLIAKQRSASAMMHTHKAKNVAVNEDVVFQRGGSRNVADKSFTEPGETASTRY